MENNHQNTIKNTIKMAIKKFKNKEISHSELIYGIVNNISALDNISEELEGSVMEICSEIETIFYMSDPKDFYIEMLKEVEKFEKVLDKHL